MTGGPDIREGDLRWRWKIALATSSAEGKAVTREFRRMTDKLSAVADLLDRHQRLMMKLWDAQGTVGDAGGDGMEPVGEGDEMGAAHAQIELAPRRDMDWGL